MNALITYDTVSVIGGILLGYFFISIWKKSVYILKTIPIVSIALLGVGLMYSQVLIRIPGDILIGFSIGLTIRGQINPP